MSMGESVMLAHRPLVQTKTCIMEKLFSGSMKDAFAIFYVIV